MFTPSQITAIRTAYRFAGMLDVETGAGFVSSIHRSWKAGSPVDVVSAMHGIAFEFSKIEDAGHRLPELEAAIACFG